MENCRKGFQILQTLAHCALDKEKNLYLMNVLNSVISQCGSLLMHFPNDHPAYANVVSFVFTFANEILSAKRV